MDFDLRWKICTSWTKSYVKGFGLHYLTAPHEIIWTLVANDLYLRAKSKGKKDKAKIYRKFRNDVAKKYRDHRKVMKTPKKNI
jgi:hypothetical protein